ncbi:MAG TPA: DUF3999 family protein [Candidatus Acidoferrum sp.]|nr:DUF3999 family protein [Candidatus Acidoferrum sp.]
MTPRRRLACSALLLFLAATAFATSLPEKWNTWKYFREISNEHPGALNYITLGPDVLANSAPYIPDLRIVDESGTETPYVLRNSINVTRTESWPAQIRENSFVPGKYTQLVLDLGARPRFHCAVRLETPETDFILWVEVDASDDARTWRIVKPRAPISRFRKEGIEGNQVVRYSENNARYLRVQIAESSHQFRVTAATVFPSSQSNAQVVVVAGIQVLDWRPPDAGSQSGGTVWTPDVGNTNVPITSLQFRTDQQEFFRGVRLSVSTDGKEWSGAGGGEIYRYTSDSGSEESLFVSVNGYPGIRYWRIEILNGNDAPLSNVQVSASIIPRLIVFRPASGHSYRVVYGNQKASYPQYDLERTLHVTAAEEAFADQLGPEQENGGFQDPRPFSEKHPAVLWGSLALAAILLGYTALRTMRTPPPATSN